MSDHTKLPRFVIEVPPVQPEAPLMDQPRGGPQDHDSTLDDALNLPTVRHANDEAALARARKLAAAHTLEGRMVNEAAKGAAEGGIFGVIVGVILLVFGFLHKARSS
jgi:hypothetical protein